jgi:DNA-binding transcriptional LysR family regulator
LIQRHPRLQIRYEVDNWERLSRSLAREEIEFFVADIRQFEADPNFQTRPLHPRRGFFWRGASAAGQGQPLDQ